MFLLPFWEDAMKTLKIFLGVGAVVALWGLGVVTADTVNESVQTPMTFSLDTGDGSSMPDLSFGTSGGAGEDASQTTCAMTPGGASTNLMMDEPVIPPVNPEQLSEHSPQQTLAPLNSLNNPPQQYNPRRPYNPQTPPTTKEDEPPPETIVPEPATLLIMALGIGAATVARRRWKNG